MNPLPHIVRSLPFCLILLLGFAGFGALLNLRKAPETTANSRSAPLVETIPVKQGSNSLRLESDGEVIPFKQVMLSAQVAGQIVFKSDKCRSGQFVQQNDRLLQIDPRDYDLEIRRTQELLKQTEVNIEELDVEQSNTEQLVQLAEQDRDLQEKEVVRYESLIERRATSQAVLDNAKRGRIQAINALQAQRNAVRLLRTRRGRLISEKDRLAVQIEQAMINRQRCDIVAPMDGVIVADPVEQDDFVQPGTALVQLEDTERLEVRFNLKLDQLRWIWDGVESQSDEPIGNTSYELPQVPVAIHMDAEGGSYEWEGQLTRYDDAGLDPLTRTVACIATVKNPRGATWKPGDAIESAVSAGRTLAPPTLLRGMYVRVEFEVPSNQPLLVIPTAALRPGNRIWLERDGKLAVKQVAVAQSRGDEVFLLPTAGVQAGDSLVITPLSIGIDGMEVNDQATVAVAGVTPTTDSVNGDGDKSSTRTGDRIQREEQAR